MTNPFKKALVCWAGSLFVFSPALAQDNCKDLFTVEAFSKSMTENLRLSREQEDLFDLYKFNYFGNPNVYIEKNFKHIMDTLEEQPQLSKKVFREQEITFERRRYKATESLSDLIKRFRGPYEPIQNKLFKVSKDSYFWKKILGFKKGSEEEFIKYFDKHLTGISLINDKSKSYKDRAVFLYKILNRVREDQIKKGKDIQRISQILLDLTHTVGLGDPYISRLIKSKNASERLEALHKLLSARDSMAIELGFEGHFSEMQKTLGLNPSSFSKKENVYDLLRQAEEELYQSPYQKINSQSFRMRALSLQESPFRSCLGGSDCSSNTYFLKALDPNFIYWTLTDQEHRSSGHITVVLGEARNKKGKSLKIGFVDKIQNVSREKITDMLAAVSKSLEEEGYSLALPKDVGDNNGLSNELTTREYIEKEVNPQLQEELFGFEPHENSYDFSNVYSRAYDKLDLYKYKADPLNLKINPGPKHAVQPAPQTLNKQKLFDQILALRDSDKEEDQIQFIRYVELAFNLNLLSFKELKEDLEARIKNKSFSLNVRKPSFFSLIELHESAIKRLGYEEAMEFLFEFSKEEQKVLTGEMSNWSRGNNTKRRDFIISLLFAEGRSEEEALSILKSDLLKPIIDINMKNYFEQSALMTAIEDHHLALAEFLIENSIDIHAVDLNGRNALIYAVEHDLPDFANQLIERGIDIHAVNLHGMTALMWALIQERPNFAKLLIEKGINIHAVDLDGRNALMWAVIRGQKELVELLIEKGADINAIDSRGKNVLLLALENHRPALAKLLIDEGIDIHVVDSGGRNALIWVIMRGYPALAELLIKKGIDIHAKSATGQSALIYTLKEGNSFILNLLLEKARD